jgi:CxxC-x17-CxxC domain-containing protein
MKKKSKNNTDVVKVMTQIQAQLAVLDRKLDTFMTKSLTELAQALAAQKPTAALRPQPAPQPLVPQPRVQSQRPMYAVICFECGKDCEIPFKPIGDRPVYCRECFAKRKAGHASKVNSDQKPQAAPAAAVKAPKPAAKVKKKAPAAKKPKAKKKTTAKRKIKKNR